MVRALLLLVPLLLPARAAADTVIGAKLACQSEYGSSSDSDAACERGVDLHARTPDDLGAAMAACDHGGGAVAEAKATACRRGVVLHARGRQVGGGREKSNFSYSWQQGHGAAQLGIGDYDVVVGDAQKSIEDCMRQFEGSTLQPSCASGLRIQRHPPPGPPGRPQP
jgi:hypothetical protein